MKCAIFMLGCSFVSTALAAPPELDRYNVVWSTPSGDSSGSMPLGNGVTGANVWVDSKGDIVLLLSRNDARSETDRLLKLGRIRVALSPSPFLPGSSFKQELVLRDGAIEITGGTPQDRALVRIYFNMAGQDLRVEGELASPRLVTATFETWRTERKTFENDDDLRSSWTMHSAPPEVRRDIVWESPDVVTTVTTGLRSGVLWYHRNEHSVVPFTLKHQGLEPIKDQFPDPLIHRTFGGFMEGISGSGLAPDPRTPGTLHTTTPVPSFGLRITTHSAQTQTAEQWRDRVYDLGAPYAGPDGARAASASWWSNFWDRSWIFAEENADASKPVPSNAHPLRIGADSNGQNIFRGWMMRTTAFHRPLTAEEIRALSTERTTEKRSVSAGGEISCSFDGAGLHTDDAGWRCLNSFGPACAWRREGGLESVRDLDQWATRFEGGWMTTVPERKVAFGDGLTLEAWIRPDKDAGPGRIFDNLTAGREDGFLFDTHPGDSLRLIVGDTTVHAKGVLKKNLWQHAAATYDPRSGRAVIYLDGSQVAESGPVGRWNDPAPSSPVTRGYVLQRWMQACSGGSRDGASGDPIKFNGSIFTVEPAPTLGQPHNADWRRWGGCSWWQNTRLPYYPMLASGDFDMMTPLFVFHERMMPGCIARAKLYYGAEGVYWPETITSFGAYSNGDYGWKRDGLAIGDISPCPWWQWAWNQSLELTQLMLDYGVYTGDERFLRERAVPMARETLRYFDSRFKLDANGKYVITPTQVLETYWKNVVGDAPVIAGLRTVTAQLLRLPPSASSAEDRAFWTRVRAATPDLPTRVHEGKTLASPAQKFDASRSNCETPELYPLWPFREYDLARPANLAWARDAYPLRQDKSAVGWTQDGLFATRLGLIDDAKAQLLARASNAHRAHRFPAMWGPNFDWLPDQCHGSNLLTQTQLMLMQADTLSDKILLLPAWPRDWNVSFKLHAPKQTTVEAVYRDGKLEKLVVQPLSRRTDIVLPEGLSAPTP